MSTPPFVHLHCHSHYSLLDGAGRIPELVNQAKDLGMNALALTDHGNLHGAIEFYRTAKHAGINPVIGYEAYVAPGHRTERDGRGLKEAAYHLTLLAQNEIGFRNLLKMASVAFLEGFHYRPRIDKELLSNYHEGLICLSGCASSEFSSLILRDRIDEAVELARWMAKLFGEGSFYIEVQNNGLEIQRRHAEVACDIASDLGLPLAATADCHYLRREDATAHDVLLCINTGRFVSDTNRMRMDGSEFFLCSPQEMADRFPKHGEALRHTQEIADRCNLELDFTKRHFPVFQCPGQTTDVQYLRQLCREGLHRRYGAQPAQQAIDRLEHELDIICRMGFASYFLIVWDFCRFAREQGIPYGARGSACGSLVGFVLQMTHIDPLEYDLLFERFLDPNRAEAPDIDIDFCQERRDEAISYVREKYGQENVAQIGTFGTMAARAVVRDVGRVMQVPLARVDQIAKLIPAPPPPVTLDDALNASTELRNEYETDPKLRELIDIGRRLEGLARQAGTHAAGVVIADKPLTQYVPLQVLVPKGTQGNRGARSAVTTQWNMGDVERAGLLKMDFLGLRNLTILHKAVRLIQRTRGDLIDPYALPMDDHDTFALLQRGETKGVFQLESGGIRDLLQKLRPDSLRDIIAVNALYRPGPLGGGMVEAYVNRKHGREQAEYIHPVLEDVLGETHGVMVYQEQVMRILNRLGGIELTNAYACIKAISKKKQETIDQFREQFIAGAQERGLGAQQAKEIFGLITHFGGYGFNKSHSTAYALVAFQTAFLKAHYPVEFMAALLSSDIPGRNFNQKDRLVEHLEDCQRMGVTVRPANVNEGEGEFTVVGGEIAFALTAIKGVGAPVVERIVTQRETAGPFADLFDFCDRVDLKVVTATVVEALVKSGAMDCFPGTRAQKAAMVANAVQAAAQLQEDRRRGQRNFLADLEDDHTRRAGTPLPNVADWSESQRLGYEKELLGYYCSSHPLARHAGDFNAYTTHKIAQLIDVNGEVIVGGIIGAVKFSNTKRSRTGNTRFAMFDLEDLSGAIRCIIWPDDFARQSTQVVAEAVCIVRAQVDRSREEPNLLISEIIPLEKAAEVFAKGVLIRLRGGVHSEGELRLVADALQTAPGPCPVYLEVLCPVDNAGSHAGAPAARRVLLKSTTERVAANTKLAARLEEILGPNHVRFLSGNGNGYRNGEQ